MRGTDANTPLRCPVALTFQAIIDLH